MQKMFSRGSASKKPQNTSIDSSPEPSSSSVPHSPVFATGMGPARPLRLVYCDDKGKFQMDPEAVAALQLVKGPIGVVSVCGRARQGKSFILNQLLGRSSGFQVASTHRPCTKGLWMWSSPLRRVALDGTEYNLLLLDSEGIDAYDQTGTYSTQIFSLAVLLSSMFIYNQMGGIDEAALDRLSLVTEMTKHIRIRASGGKTSTSELGQFAPIFVWLLRDFYLDLTEDNRKIAPRDYLELALRPVQSGGKDTVAKNEIRESVRALFPDRECFTLVRPLNNEKELQRLDQISLEKLRPEFRSGLDALVRFVFERTRPKQVGATTMTGPILAGITQSFLDALNNGAVPTISTSWQSVEEAECRRAYDAAAQVYMSCFDRSKPAEEVPLREAHEEAVQKSLAEFNAVAVGFGSARQKYEKLLQSFFKKEFEDYKKNAFVEADSRCSNAIQSMEKKLRAACHGPDAKIEHVINVLCGLLSEYEVTSHGPGKWQKLATFLQHSVKGLIHDHVKKQLDKVGSEKDALLLKCRSTDDRMVLLKKQLEASDQIKTEYLTRYEDGIKAQKKLSDEYALHISNLQSQCSSMEERCSSLSKVAESAKQESLEWKRKYEHISSKKKAEEDQANAELAALKSRIGATEARLAAAQEQTKSAEEEAAEWKRKFDLSVRETKIALEKAATIQERTNNQTQKREDALRAEFSALIAEKEEEIMDKLGKIEYSEQRRTSAVSDLKAVESKLKSYEVQISTQNVQIKELWEKLDATKVASQSFENKVRILEQEKTHIDQKYSSEFKMFEEAQERCKRAENDAKRAIALADTAQTEAAAAQKEKADIQRVAMERLNQIEKTERRIESLERQKNDLLEEADTLRTSQTEALSKVAMLEDRVEEREKEIELLLQSNNEQRASTVHVLEGLLESERNGRAEANTRAEALSKQLQYTQAKLDSLQQELTSSRLNESALDSRLRTTSHGKRSRVNDYSVGVESVHDMEVDDKLIGGRKKSKSATSPLKYAQMEDVDSPLKGDDANNSNQQIESDDYVKFTVSKLRQELTTHGFGAELLQLKNPNKKDILLLYEKHVLQK